MPATSPGIRWCSFIGFAAVASSHNLTYWNVKLMRFPNQNVLTPICHRPLAGLHRNGGIEDRIQIKSHNMSAMLATTHRPPRTAHPRMPHPSIQRVQTIQTVQSSAASPPNELKPTKTIPLAMLMTRSFLYCKLPFALFSPLTSPFSPS